MNATKEMIRGRARVAHEFGVSERTVSRWRRKGLIEVKQLGGRTSAWRAEPAALKPPPSPRRKED